MRNKAKNRVTKVAFIGSRGIPAKYGGNEVFLEEISGRLLEKGFGIYIGCESNRPYIDEYCGVTRIHTPSIEGKTLTVPALKQILSTLHLLLRCPSVDVIVFLSAGGALAAPLPRLMGKKIVVNTDGIEWKRLPKRRTFASAPWKPLYTLTDWGLRFSEWVAVKIAHTVVADSMAIKEHLETRYGATNVAYASYGARELINPDIAPERELEILERFGLVTGEYYLSVARIVAENNIHMKIKGYQKSGSAKQLAMVGNFNEKDRYNQHLFELRNGNSQIVFLDPIYEQEVLGILRKNCYAYLHAYEIGGTNPSLLEQMLFKPPILAYDVPFHREVLQAGGILFNNAEHLAECIQRLELGEFDLDKMNKVKQRRLDEEYNWDQSAEAYEQLFRNTMGL